MATVNDEPYASPTTVSLRRGRRRMPRGSDAQFPVERSARSRVTETTRPCDEACCVDADENIGRLIGNYRLLERIGEGGMGHVYLAEHVRLGRRVALKVLRHELAMRPSAVARFLREARIVSRIRHTNIVQLEDLIEADGGPPCLVMELLTGRSLRDVLRSQRALDLARTIDIGVQICSALEAIHALGVLHRDLTPCNIFLCDKPGDDAVAPSTCVKLLDFGVAKLLSNDPPGTDSGEHVTAEGAIIGTPGYMSPEQASGGTIDARSDLYSLGVLLYELVGGEPLVTGKTFGECVRAHIADTPRPLHTTARGRNAPPALAALVMRCLAKRADQRPASAADLRRALLALGTPAAPPPSRRLRIWILALATVATVSIAARAASWPSQPDRSPAPGTTAPTQAQQCSIPADENSSRSPER